MLDAVAALVSCKRLPVVAFPRLSCCSAQFIVIMLAMHVRHMDTIRIVCLVFFSRSPTPLK